MIFKSYQLSLLLIFFTGFRLPGDLALSDIFLGGTLASFLFINPTLSPSYFFRMDYGRLIIFISTIFISLGFLLSATYRGRLFDVFPIVAQYIFLVGWFYLSANLAYSDAHIKKLIACVVMSSAISSLAALVQSLGIMEMPYASMSGRMTGLSRHPNELGGTACFGMMLSFSMWLFEKNNIYSKNFWLALFATCSIGVVLSASISALLSALIAMIFCIYIYVGIYGMKAAAPLFRSLFAVSFFMGIIFFAAVLSGGIDVNDENFLFNRLNYASDADSEYNTVAIRWAGYVDAVDFINENPVFGIGGKGFSAIDEEIHNLFLKSWMEAGLLGFFGSILLIFGIIYTIYIGFFLVYVPGMAGILSGIYSAAITFVINSMSAPVSTQRSGWVAVAFLMAGCSLGLFKAHSIKSNI